MLRQETCSLDVVVESPVDERGCNDCYKTNEDENAKEVLVMFAQKKSVEREAYICHDLRVSEGMWPSP